MSKENNLTDFLTDIANTLRTQTNTTATINPQNFSTMISNDLVGKDWVAGHYLPLSGGTITNDTTIMGSTGQYGIKFTNGDIQFLSDGGATVVGTITGISSSKGTSTTRVMSEKGVADNYIAKTDISNTTGTDTTKVPSLKCLEDNYLPLSGGELNDDGYLMIFKASDSSKGVVLDGDGLKFLSGDGWANTTSLSGISDSKGTSSDIAVSQKCLKDNYLPLSGGTVSGELKVQQNVATDYGATTYTVNLNKGKLSLDFTSDVINFSTSVSYGLISTPRIETNDITVNGNGTTTLSGDGIAMSYNNNAISLGNESCDITKTENYTTKGMSLLFDKIVYYDNQDDGPKWTFAGTVFSTTDLVAGSSALPSNQLYFVYE